VEAELLYAVEQKDEETDMTKLVFAFRSFANEPETRSEK
jgi:hypothetical protein